MQSNKLIIPLYGLLFLLICQDTVSAQDSTEVNVQQKGKYAFVLYGGGGLFNYAAPVGSPAIESSTSYTRIHPMGTARLMWHPDHRLRVGLETGYVLLYEYSVTNGNTKGKMQLTAIPILVVWSMAVSTRINVFTGIGYYWLTTHLNYNGKVVARSLSLGFNASVNYVQPISRKIGIGIEGKWSEASQTKDYGISGELMLVWKFFEW